MQNMKYGSTTQSLRQSKGERNTIYLHWEPLLLRRQIIGIPESVVLAAHLGKEIHKDSLEGVEWNRFNQDNNLILVLLFGGRGAWRSLQVEP